MQSENQPYLDHLFGLTMNDASDQMIKLFLLKEIEKAQNSTPDLYLCLVEETFDLSGIDEMNIDKTWTDDAPPYGDGLSFLTRYNLMPEDFQP